MEALGSLGYNIASPAYWHPTFPYKSPLTGNTSQELAEGYEKSSGRQWNQQLGATQSLLDVGAELLKAASNPKDKAEVVKTLSHFKVTTAVGVVEWGNSRPERLPDPADRRAMDQGQAGQQIQARPGDRR